MTTKHNLDFDNIFTMNIDKLSALLFCLVSIDVEGFSVHEGDAHELHGDDFILQCGTMLQCHDPDDRVVGFDIAIDWARLSYPVFSAMERGVPFEMCIKEIDRQRDLFWYSFPDCSNEYELRDHIERSLRTLHLLLPTEDIWELNTGWRVADLNRLAVKQALKHGLPPRHKATVEIFLTDLMKRAQSSEGDISMSTQFGPLIMFGKDEAIDDGTYTPQRRQILSDVFDIWANTIDAQVEKTKQAVLDLFNYARQPKRNKVKLKRADEEPSH